MPTDQSGGSISFDQFFAAIGGQESGGDYTATNPSGASGKYQILRSNIDPWSRKYLGRSMSYSDYMQHPELQEKLARAVLSDYFGKYGARGAAAAWYSGDPNKANNYNHQSNGPSIGDYVDQVLGRVGKNGGVSPKPGATPAFGQQPDPLAPVANGVDSLTVTPDTLGRTQSGMQQASAVPGLTTSGKTGSDPQRDRVIAEAMRYIGTPYVWGGTSPKGFDCSGFVQYVLNGVAGLNLPRISNQQANAGQRVDLSQLRAGDLVAMDNSGRNSGADHIAIYAGNNQIIEAPHAGASVRLRSISPNEGFWGVALNY